MILENILVSVVIPAYNVEDYLGRCLESVTSQSLKSIEIIVIDNGSSDNTRKIIKDFSERYDNIIPIYCDRNIRPSGARNMGIEAAHGKYIFFCDADDSITENGLEQLVIEAERKNADAVVGNYSIESDNSHFVSVCGKRSPEEAYLYARVVWTILFKKKAIEHIRFQPYSYGEDTLFILEVYPNLKKISSISDCIYQHFSNKVAGKVVSLTQNLQAADLFEYIEVLDKMFEITRTKKDSLTYNKKNACENLIISYLNHLLGYWERLSFACRTETFDALKNIISEAYALIRVHNRRALRDLLKINIEIFKKLDAQSFFIIYSCDQNKSVYWTFREQCNSGIISFKSVLPCLIMTIRPIKKLAIFFLRIKRTLFAKAKTISKIIEPMFFNLNKGFALYRKIRNEFGSECTIILNPFPGMGDIFLMAKHLPEYLNKNKINNYVFVVPGNAAYNACLLYGTGLALLKLTCEEMDLLVYFSVFIGEENINTKIFHHHILMDFNSLGDRLQGLNGLNMKEMLINITMDIDGNKKTLSPNFISLTNEDYNFFTKYSMIPQKSVILAPYANSNGKYLNSIDFWNLLAVKLLQKGFSVFTNCIGTQEPLEKTVPISFPLEKGNAYLEYAGYFIAWRSGLCDILGHANCKKIVLYDANFKIGQAYYTDFYNINEIGLGENIFELSMNLVNTQESISKLLALL